MKLLCFEEWVNSYGIYELEDYQIVMEREGDEYVMTNDEKDDWLSDAYGDYISYREDLAYDEYRERDI